MSEVLFISNARLSFPHLTEPQLGKRDDGTQTANFNGDLILPKDGEGFKLFMARFIAMAQAEWKENANGAMQMIQNDRKARCYGFGEEKVKKTTFQPYDGYAGQAYISVNCGNTFPAGQPVPSRLKRPQMIRSDGTAVDSNNLMEWQAIARTLYAGCRVNAAVKPWLQIPAKGKSYGNGVRCDLIAIQFAGDDTPFGEAAPDVTPMFGAVVATPTVAGPAAMGLPPFMMGQ